MTDYQLPCSSIFFTTFPDPLLESQRLQVTCCIHETWKKILPAVDLLGGTGLSVEHRNLPAAEKHFSSNENIFMVILK